MIESGKPLTFGKDLMVTMDEALEDEISIKTILVMVKDLTDIVDILHTEVSALKKLCAKETEGEDAHIRVVRVDSKHFMHG